MLHPDHFTVNEAWLVFRLNEAPISTDGEGDFNCIALMDAASCFILSIASISVGEFEPSTIAVRRLMNEGKAHKGQLPKKLFLPDGQFTRVFPAEARRLEIEVVRAPEDELVLFIGEARESFREHFSGSRLQ
jgi:hypothetical protein